MWFTLSCSEIGVEEVTADCKASKVVVKGKTADPIKVCQRIQKKSGRKAVIISPLPKQPPQEDDKQQENKEEPKQEIKKEEVYLYLLSSSFLFTSNVLYYDQLIIGDVWKVSVNVVGNGRVHGTTLIITKN